jgi:hypothetical protein
VHQLVNNKNFDNIKMYGMYVGKKKERVDKYCHLFFKLNISPDYDIIILWLFPLYFKCVSVFTVSVPIISVLRPRGCDAEFCTCFHIPHLGHN